MKTYYVYTDFQDAPFVYEWSIEDLETKHFVEVAYFTVDPDWNEVWQKCWINVVCINKVYNEEDLEIK